MNNLFKKYSYHRILQDVVGPIALFAIGYTPHFV